MAQKRILIVEDESIIALELKTYLADLGYNVVDLAASGEQAIEAAGRYRPDLVLMDIILRGKMDGIEAAGQIRSRYGLPVIFLTAHTDDQTLQRAKVTDPFGYLIKPFQMRDLNIAIEMGLYKHEMEQKLRQSEERLRLLIESTEDVILVQDLNRRYLYVHGSAQYGINTDVPVGKLPSDFFPPEFIAEMDLHHARVMQTGKGTTTEIEVNWRARRLWFNLHIYPLRDVTGQITSVATIARNVTEMKRLKGMLPICAWCGKKIMGDNGQWQPLDRYIVEHSSAKVTHSICDNCLNQEMQKIKRS